jgi:hypothetical protein
MTPKERRDLAKLAGKCRTCRTRKPEPNMQTCAHCLQGRDNLRGGAEYHDCCQSSAAHRFDCEARAVPGVAYRRRAA